MAYAYRKGPAWYVGYKDETGRPVQRPTKARTKTEASKIAQELERTAERIRLGLETKSTEMTVGDLWTKWREAKGDLASAKFDEVRWRKHLAPKFSGMPVRMLTAGELEKHLLSMKRAGDKRQKGKLSPQSLDHLRRLLGRMIRWAQRKGLWAGVDPTRAVELPEIVERVPVTADPMDVVRLLAAAREPYRTIYAIGVYAGLRSAEILGLEVERVNLIAGVILVDQQSTRTTTKAGTYGVLPIVAELRPYLEAHLATMTARNVTGRLFPFPDLKDPRSHILDELKRTLKRAGLPGSLTVHGLRHTFISSLSMAGADPRAVQALARHADLGTTQRYIHLRDRYLQEQAAKLSYTEPEVKA